MSILTKFKNFLEKIKTRLEEKEKELDEQLSDYAEVDKLADKALFYYEQLEDARQRNVSMEELIELKNLATRYKYLAINKHDQVKRKWEK